jgi:hypothetical protein
VACTDRAEPRRVTPKPITPQAQHIQTSTIPKAFVSVGRKGMSIKMSFVYHVGHGMLQYRCVYDLSAQRLSPQDWAKLEKEQITFESLAAGRYV